MMKNRRIKNRFLSGCRVCWCLSAAIFFSFSQYAAYAQTYLPAGSISGDQILSPQALEPSAVIPKLETPLSELYLERNQTLSLSPRLSGQVGEYLVDNGVRVVIVAESESFITALKEAVAIAGGDIVARFGTKLEVTVPVDELKNLSELDGVLYIRRPIPVYPMDSGSGVEQPITATSVSTGTFVTQGVSASMAHLWHAKNITGAGVRVAVLDYFKDFSTAQARGELPPSITKYGIIDTTSSRHGTAVAEIIYDMAPGVNMTFATPGSATQMASYITALAQAGNKVISSSIGFSLMSPGTGQGMSPRRSTMPLIRTVVCIVRPQEIRPNFTGMVLLSLIKVGIIFFRPGQI